MITGISKLEKDLRKPKMWSELLMPIAELIRPQPYPSCYQLGARYTSATKSFSSHRPTVHCTIYIRERFAEA